MKNKKTIFSLVFLITIIFTVSAMAAAPIPVEVPVGKGTIVTLKERSMRVSLSDPTIADLILISPTELLINGKKIGSTSLIVWDKNGEKTFFNIFIVGDLGALIDQVAELAPDGDISIEMAKDSVILKGMLKNQETINRIVELSKAYAPKIINFLRVKEPQQVMLEVKVVQINRTKLKEIGINALVKGHTAEGFGGVGPAIPGGELGGTTGYPLAPTVTGFSLDGMTPEIGVAHFKSGVAAVLDALQEEGVAKILAEPNLVVRSGERGSFLAGSRVPVQQVSGVGGSQTISVEFEEVGVKVVFVPEVLETGMIRLKIDPAEVSNIVRFVTFGAGVVAPQIDTREVRTSVDLMEGESLILAGLLSDETRLNVRKIPLLGDIPILGALFRSKSEEITKTELTFFITPKLVTPIKKEDVTVLPGEELTEEDKRKMRWIPLSPFKVKDKDQELTPEQEEVVDKEIEAGELPTEPGTENSVEGINIDKEL